MSTTGTTRLWDGRTLVVSFWAPADFDDWVPDEKVTIVLDSGESCTATLVAARSTGSGSVSAGQMLRLWLEVAEVPQPGRPVFVELRVAGRSLEIEL